MDEGSPTLMMYVIAAAIAVGINLLFYGGLFLFRLIQNKRQLGMNEDVAGEIMSMVEESHEQGVLKESEAEMIHNIFEFGDKEAKDIMTHRMNIQAFPWNISVQEALDDMLEKGNTRYPVYEKDIDNILGILHMKDLVRCYVEEGNRTKYITQVKGLIRPAAFIPETRNINLLFKTMQSEKIHMVIVVDEYGQTAGLVAMEDILEEIVGNIFDEFDQDEEYIILQKDGSYLLDGMTPLEELEKIFSLDFEKEEYETLNGYLISKLDRIPQEEEKPEIESDGYLFKILRVENNTIQSVVAKKIDNVE